MPANRKTSNSKSTDRGSAVANPPVTGKPRTAGPSKAAERSRAGGTSKSTHTSKATGKSKGSGKPKAAGNLIPAANGNSTRTRPPLKSLVLDALADMKALEVKVLDVRGLTDVADFMVIASGTSDRHVRSVAQRVVERTKEAGFRPHGVEGQQDSDWVLIDLNEMIVHVMLPRVREFYGLEKLWDLTATKRAARA